MTLYFYKSLLARVVGVATTYLMHGSPQSRFKMYFKEKAEEIKIDNGA
jgi:hypothetical protein